jgi:hypothetical protein
MTIAIGVSLYVGFVALVLLFNKGAARNERAQQRADEEVDAVIPQLV